VRVVTPVLAESFSELYRSMGRARVAPTREFSEINIVSVADTDAGNVQTYVGFGSTKEQAEKNALGACSHTRFDLETCLESDRVSGSNSNSADSSLHLKYMKAAKRITGCS
jgi:hypothetical protein